MVWCGVVWCGVVWCGVVWCGVVWCGVVWCGVVWWGNANGLTDYVEFGKTLANRRKRVGPDPKRSALPVP